MKWYEDTITWGAILLVMVLVGMFAYKQGISTVVDSCDTYRAYKPDDSRVLLCMTMPITQRQGVGEKEYLRPEGSKVDQTFKRT